MHQLCKNLNVTGIKHPWQFLLFLPLAPKLKIQYFGLIVVKKKKPANYTQLTAEFAREWLSLAIINEFHRSKCMTLTVCKTCILIKKISDKDTKIQSTLKTKFLHKQVCYQSNTRHIPPNTGLLPALISLSEMNLKLTFLRVPCPPWD